MNSNSRPAGVHSPSAGVTAPAGVHSPSAGVDHRRAGVLAANLRVFDMDHPGLRKFLMEKSVGNAFAASLSFQLTTKGTLSEKQIAAAVRMQTETPAPKLSGTACPNLAAAFAAVKDAGLKYAELTTDLIVVKEAGANSRNAGGLYVFFTGSYLGKIVGGTFTPAKEATQEGIQAFLDVEQDPAEAARLYGKRTGRCSCCRRELTDPVSVERGIGPICEGKWRLK